MHHHVPWYHMPWDAPPCALVLYALRTHTQAKFLLLSCPPSWCRIGNAVYCCPEVCEYAEQLDILTGLTTTLTFTLSLALTLALSLILTLTLTLQGRQRCLLANRGLLTLTLTLTL